MLKEKLQQTLDERAKNFLLRHQVATQSSPGPYLWHQGKQYLTFSSNDYLGLAHHPNVIAAATQALQHYGVGSGSAYLISGYSSAHQALEERLADFLQYPKVLLFSSGYMANIGTIQALFSKGDQLFADKANHASLLDGCLASAATLSRYPNVHLVQLQKLCEKYHEAPKAIITEGLFGMDGNMAPLDKIAQLAAKHCATLMVDDAHGIGVIGNNGQGSVAHHQLTVKQVPILVGTLGKAFGAYGGFVASNELIIQTLTQLARTYVYTTAIPPAIAAAAQASLAVMQVETWRREILADHIRYFKRCMQQLNLPTPLSETPIQPILLSNAERTIALDQQLFAKGIYVKAIRPPTASARLRVTLTADHRREHIDYLCESLADVYQPH